MDNKVIEEFWLFGKFTIITRFSKKATLSFRIKMERKKSEKVKP